MLCFVEQYMQSWAMSAVDHGRRHTALVLCRNTCHYSYTHEQHLLDNIRSY